MKAGFRNVIAITTASVPIVKFEDPATGLHVDLNCNEQLGLVNTILLNNYCAAWTPLRRMIFFLKKWAKSLGLNDPSGTAGPSSFSSYCLALMTVGFLQVRWIRRVWRSLLTVMSSVPRCFAEPSRRSSRRGSREIWLLDALEAEERRRTALV